MIFGLQLALTVKQESLTWDEGDHIFAGYMSWKTHDYGLNPEHPPLMKMLATVPLLGLPLKVPELQHRFFKAEAYMSGKAMLFGNAPEYSVETLTFRVRMAAGIVAILLGLLVFLATREMFGVVPAFVTLILLTFEPNILAHGAFVTTDVGVSCFFFAAIYAFYRYCKQPTPARLAITGLASGLALGKQALGGAVVAHAHVAGRLRSSLSIQGRFFADKECAAHGRIVVSHWSDCHRDPVGFLWI